MSKKVTVKTRFADGVETVEEVILDRSLDAVVPTTENEVAE
jgi:hypothetical protein